MVAPLPAYVRHIVIFFHTVMIIPSRDIIHVLHPGRVVFGKNAISNQKKGSVVTMMQKIQKFVGAMFTPVLLFSFAVVMYGIGTLCKTEAVLGYATVIGHWGPPSVVPEKRIPG